MSMGKKAKGKSVDGRLNIKSFAQLEKEVQASLDACLEDKDITEFVNDGQPFAGWSPAHTINGEDYDELMEKKKKAEDEDT